MNIKLLFAFILLIPLTSCFDEKKVLSIDPSHIKIDDDIYLKPLGKNEKGCSTFSPYSLNKDAILEMLGRFTEDLTSLQKAIRNDDTKFLEKVFSSTKNIRKLIEEIGQAGSFDPTESENKLKKS